MPAPTNIDAENLARCEDLMIQRYSISEISEKMIDEGRCNSHETVRKWRCAVMRRWADEEKELRPHYKNLWRLKLDRKLRYLDEKIDKAETNTDIAFLQAEWTKVARVSIALDGLSAAHIAPLEGAPDPLSMTPLERQREIDTLLAKRTALKNAPAGN